MKYVYLGKITNTHGIKGEIRILSNFDRKSKVFIPGMKLYIGEKKEEEIISSYRYHKIYDMVMLEGYNDINEILKYKGKKVYINRDDLDLKEDDYLLSDLVGLDIIYNDKSLGKVKEIVYNNSNVLLMIDGEKTFYIPVKGDFIKKVNLEKNEIIVEHVEGLII